MLQDVLNIELSDKNLVIVCTTIIALVSMFQLPDPVGIVSNIVAGLFGVAVGKALK